MPTSSNVQRSEQFALSLFNARFNASFLKNFLEKLQQKYKTLNDPEVKNRTFLFFFSDFSIKAVGLHLDFAN